MPLAARVNDLTDHPGSLIGPGAKRVFIEKMPAARVGDGHICAFPSPGGPHGPNAVMLGSLSVFIEKQPAARRDDRCTCGAAIITSALTVNIG